MACMEVNMTIKSIEFSYSYPTFQSTVDTVVSRREHKRKANRVQTTPSFIQSFRPK